MTDFADLDPFELPDWLGSGRVTWRPDEGTVAGSLIHGELASEAGDAVDCDLVAVDQAYPRPIAPDDVRTGAHLAWHHGQVHVTRRDGRPTLLVPGATITADLALEALGRLAQAVGARRGNFQALLQVPGTR